MSLHAIRTKIMVLGSRDFREADRMIVGYSPEYGLLELLAKGSRKSVSKLAPLLGCLTLVDAMIIRGKKFDVFASGMLIDGYEDIKGSYMNFMACQYAGALIQQYTAQGEYENNIFVHLLEFVENIRGKEEISRERIEHCVEDFKNKILHAGGWIDQSDYTRPIDYGYHFPSSYKAVSLQEYFYGI